MEFSHAQNHITLMFACSQNFKENFRMGGAFKWPPLSDVVEYRRNVRNVVTNIIKDTPLQLPITMESRWVSTLSHRKNSL